MSFSLAEFEIIYKRCHPRALGLSISMLGNEDEARDTVQQVFASLWESQLKVDNPDAFIYRAVRNRCLNRLEQLDTRERIRGQYALLAQESDSSPGPLIEDVYNAADFLLSERERQVVSEIFEKGNNYKAAAANLKLSTSSINKYITSALKTLRLHFKTQKQ